MKMNQKPFVLLVEDDEKLRWAIATNLNARGYLVFEAGSFSEAIEQFAIKPQLLILDIRLPDATGWDFLSWAQNVTAAVPTIVISGFMPERREIERFAPAKFLRKPFSIGQLIGLVEASAPMS
jgi:DNA-binding response OmpR family regulator